MQQEQLHFISLQRQYYSEYIKRYIFIQLLVQRIKQEIIGEYIYSLYQCQKTFVYNEQEKKCDGLEKTGEVCSEWTGAVDAANGGSSGTLTAAPDVVQREGFFPWTRRMLGIEENAGHRAVGNFLKSTINTILPSFGVGNILFGDTYSEALKSYYRTANIGVSPIFGVSNSLNLFPTKAASRFAAGGGRVTVQAPYNPVTGRYVPNLGPSYSVPASFSAGVGQGVLESQTGISAPLPINNAQKIGQTIGRWGNTVMDFINNIF